MKILWTWYEKLSYGTRDLVSSALTLLACLGVVVLFAVGLICLAEYASHGGREEPCYADLTCEAGLTCVPCRQGCSVSYTCLPPGHP